jgi:hypothetical protein
MLTLHGADQSEIAPARFRAVVEDYLRHGRPAWDPYVGDGDDGPE